LSLTDWEKNGWLVRHKTSRDEIQNLMKIIQRDLEDSSARTISADWRFAIAYNAALQCCTVVLYCRGFRPARGQSEYYRVIQSIVLTMGRDYIELRDYLNACRTKGNISDYDMAGTISESEAIELIDTVKELYLKLKEWLYNNYPEYL